MTTQTNHCQEYEQVSRRTFLSRGTQSAAALLFGNKLMALPSWMPRISLADPHVGPAGDTLVCIFLRGGADGLNMVVPHGDEQYYAHRPLIGIPRPDDNKASDGRTVNLDGFLACTRCWLRCTTFTRRAIWPSFTPPAPPTKRAPTLKQWI